MLRNVRILRILSFRQMDRLEDEEKEKDNIKSDVLYPFWFCSTPRDYPYEDYRIFKSEINHFRKIMFSK